jgi:hypothetical protein
VEKDIKIRMRDASLTEAVHGITDAAYKIKMIIQNPGDFESPAEYELTLRVVQYELEEAYYRLRDLS